MSHQSLFAISSEAILTIGQDFTIQETNPAFGALMGYEEESVQGQRCFHVLRCRDERRILLCETARCPLREAFDMETSAPVRDLIWQTRTGKFCEVSANVATHSANNESRAVVVARDITLLNAANRLRANFISMVSHELRTPLNSINGFLEIVLEGQVGALNPRQQEFLEYAHTSTQQLTTLVEDVLFISRADAGQFSLRLAHVEIAKLLEDLIQTLQPAAEKAEARLALSAADDLPATQADPLRLQQVLTNLINNALKFSPAEGVVRVAVERRGPELLFAINDQGRGVAPEDHARIFERFYQSDSNVRSRTGGYGLGLSIAKLIVEQHGGRIWVDSQPGEGATFSFTLPIKDDDVEDYASL